MLKKLLGRVSIFLVFISLAYAYPRNVKDYQISGREFVIVVIVRGEMTRSSANRIALQRASEITYDHGYRYFKIKKLDWVTFIGTEGRPRKFPRNIYQEDIVERGMGREPMLEDGVEVEEKALKMVIEFLEEKKKGAINACDYLNC